MKKKNVKKIIIAVVTVILSALLIDSIVVLIAGFFTSYDEKTGVTLSLTDVSAKGAMVILEQDASEETEEAIYGSDFFIQRRCLFGWHKIKEIRPGTFLTAGLVLKKGERDEYYLEWSKRYGRLLPGIYRINKGLNRDIELYRPFVVLF